MQSGFNFDLTSPQQDADHTERLLSLMHAHSTINKKLLPKQITIQNTNGDLFQLTLSHQVLIEAANETSLHARVIGSERGRGANAVAYEVLGSLKNDPTTGLVTFKPGKRIAKKNAYGHSYSLENEFQRLKRIHAFNAKSCAEIGNGDAIITMDDCGEVDLEKTLQKDAQDLTHGENHLSVEERLRLSIGAIRALMNIHLHQLLHCDVKPANLIVNPKKPYIDSHCIDLGLSQDIRMNTKRRCGTPYYLPLEGQDEDVKTVEQDIYGLGMVISEIWRTPTIQDTFPEITTVPELKEKLKTYQINMTFEGLNDVDNEEKMMITKILCQMTSQKADERPSLNEVLQIFEKLLLKKEASWKDETYALAAEVRNRLDEQHMKNTPGTMLTPEMATTLLRNTEMFIYNNKRVLLDENAIACFKFYVGVAHFQHAKTREDVMDSLRSLKESFSLGHHHLQILLKKIKSDPNSKYAESEMGKLLHEVEALNQRCVKALTVDNIAYIDQKFKKYLPVLMKKFDALAALTVSSPCPSIPYAGSSALLFGAAKQGISPDTAPHSTLNNA